MRKIFVIVIGGIFLMSCNKLSRWDCFKSTGEVATKTVSTGKFSVLEIKSYFRITLIQDSQNYVLFKGGENLLPKIKAITDDGILQLKDENKCLWVRDYEKERPEAEVHFTTLDSIIAYRECDITSKGTIKNNIFLLNFIQSHLATLNINIDVDDFYLKINPSSGDYYVRGTCWNNYIFSIGYSYVHTEHLDCVNSYVYSYSTGNIYVGPREILEAHIFNHGNVYCVTKPVHVKLEKPDYAAGNLIYE
jgi:hypothetical protein